MKWPTLTWFLKINNDPQPGLMLPPRGVVRVLKPPVGTVYDVHIPDSSG